MQAATAAPTIGASSTHTIRNGGISDRDDRRSTNVCAKLTAFVFQKVEPSAVITTGLEASGEAVRRRKAAR